MNREFVRLFGVMMAVLIPVAIGGGFFVLIASFAKKRGVWSNVSASSSEQFNQVLDTLERMELQLQQLEERLDFVERILPSLREGKPLPQLPPRSSPPTPR